MSAIPVITIGREHGSGGRQVGKLLAERLGIECYDTRFITEAAQHSKISEEIFKSHNEKITNSPLYSIFMFSTGIPNLTWDEKSRPLVEQVCKVQFDMVRKLAQKPCVIVGRCADSVLDDTVQKCRIFVRAEMTDRIGRIMDGYQLGEKEAEKAIRQADKERASYYNFYTGKRWGDSRHYDLCINTSGLGIENTVDLIVSYMEKKGN